MSDVEQLVRAAHDSLRVAGVQMGASKVSKLCRFYVRNVEQTRHQGFIPWLIGQSCATGQQAATLEDALYRRLTYADPTGETAVHNVSRSEGLTRDGG